MTADPTSLFPIRELSRRTGVNAVTLRAWERRYGLLKPFRTPKGHRLYDEEDVQRVEAILEWINRGIPVREVKALLDRQVPADEGYQAADEWREARSLLLEAALSLQEERIDALYNQYIAQYPVKVCLRYWLEPVMRDLAGQEGRQTAKAFLQSCLRTRLGVRVLNASRQNRSALVWLILGRDTDGWPLWIAAALLAEAGCRVRLLDHPLCASRWKEVLQADQSLPGKVGALVYQDGRFNAIELESCRSLLNGHQIPIAFTGTAPVLAALPDGPDRWPVAQPSEAVAGLLEALNGS